MSAESLKFEIESKTVADFRKMGRDGQLVLRPEYQRQAVWPDRAKVSLMETILLGYPIPEVYLAYETTSDGDETASVVDGQQRLTALLEFIDNKYSLDELEDEGLRKKFSDFYFRDLPEEVRRSFFQFRFPIRRLSNLDDEFIRSVFARVNRVNMVLTPQELRNALLPGPFTDFLRDCSAHTLNFSSGVFSGERRKRGGDIEFYAEVFGTCIYGISNKKSELDERYDKLSAGFDEFAKLAEEFLEMMSSLEKTVKWQGQTRWSNIVDLFTLLHVSWDFRAAFAAMDEHHLVLLREALDAFQRAVSSFKRDEDSDRATERLAQLSDKAGWSGSESSERVEAYVSGIRNSSDLGSRRNRYNALQYLFTELVTALPPV